MKKCVVCDQAKKDVTERVIYERGSNGEYEESRTLDLCNSCYYDYYATPDELEELREMQEINELY